LGLSKAPPFCILHRFSAAIQSSPHPRSPTSEFWHRFRVAAQFPYWGSKCGGTGDAGTSGHHGVVRRLPRVGCCPLTLAPISAAPIATTITIATATYTIATSGASAAVARRITIGAADFFAPISTVPTPVGLRPKVVRCQVRRTIDRSNKKPIAAVLHAWCSCNRPRMRDCLETQDRADRTEGFFDRWISGIDYTTESY